ncbi:hypothetical protein [Pseudonocardia alni]|uniref:Uncharacterized protein n=1 Tax=Pseudonocardia alni TaxID=33907 RepID=A0A852W476_PSEA5|nr:hypothetical protein [Pseudonocardia antarctica]NYG00352.1 hypothetical protein [Pseudonocardia antarctica]
MTDEHTSARALQDATRTAHRKIGRLVATLQELPRTGVTEDARARLEAAALDAEAAAGHAAQLARDVTGRR